MNLPYALAIHGGAGTIIPGSSKEPQYLEALQQVIDTGEKILSKGGTAVEAVLACVIALEDCPLFNAGRGSAFTSTGTHEMDASIMNGQTLAVGAVAGVRTIRNPIYLAHVLMHHPNHNFLIGEGAELFARTCNDIAIVSPNYFYTAERMEQLKYVQSLSNEALLLDHDAAMQSTKFGTVGAVARDRFGQLAAATSTGGLTNKLLGRVGDTPLIGAGCYADSNTVAVSATGTGEAFIRAILAYDIAARIKYTHVSLEEATREVVLGKLTELGGQGGIIAIDKEGNISMPFNTKGMYRGWAKEGKGSAVAVGR
ncbi:MAG: isoaspartyl peptidase/L-asparaginase [Pseudomonadota bacterium]